MERAQRVDRKAAEYRDPNDAGVSAEAGRVPVFATSASLDLVELLVVANVGQVYRDLADAGKAQIDAA
ncbi:MAG: hypothetical protein JO363_13560 [Solirubrobacterales bacterium]|nr:hypothetical protein [Solirubrobacterales bacterium]